jgi:hypothetical protein
VRAEPKSGPQRVDCAAVECDPQRCAAVRCAAPQSPADFVAACRENRCVALPRRPQPEPPAAAECRIDRDCTVTSSPAPGSACLQSPCGCCPSPRAVPVEARPVPLPERPQPKPTPPGPPPFGLSTGSAPPAPQCAPCPAPPPAGKPVCLGGRCTLTPEAPQPRPPPMPRPRPPVG